MQNEMLFSPQNLRRNPEQQGFGHKKRPPQNEAAVLYPE
jgi:hypothetical protein